MNPMNVNAVLPFIMAGDPGLTLQDNALERLPGLLAEAFALNLPALEIGLPHSDPVADGPVLQAAAQRAIRQGVTARRVLESLAGLRESPDLVLFSYFNPLLQLGDDLLRLLRPTPVRSLLVVDLPFGEETTWEESLRREGYPLVSLLSPLASKARTEYLLDSRPGDESCFAKRFAYVVGRLGVTGSGGRLDMTALHSRLEGLRQMTDRPLAVGFGLQDPSVMREIRRLGATPIVGSALVERLAKGENFSSALGALAG